ncbi:MAG: hypothetical protein NUV58_03495 [Candidatus Roizmanbacteria bacterium]|nr:hypothetical protein [Candidatus Roizmanbacteria bacterium]
MRIREKHSVPMEDVVYRSKKSGEHHTKKNVVGVTGSPSAVNKFTFDTVHFKGPTKLENFIYTSLSSLGGLAIGIITYLNFIRPLVK